MPNVGDELHHYGYSHDQKRLIVPGLFSSRIHVFDIKGDGKQLALRAVNDQLAEKSGYVVPHGVMAMSRGRALVTMIGAANDSTLPGGMVEIDDKTGRSSGTSVPDRSGSRRSRSEVHVRLRVAARGEPRHQHDVRPAGAVRRGSSRACLGSEVAVWDLEQRKVIQTADLGANSGALMVHFSAGRCPAGVHQRSRDERDLAGRRRRRRRRLRLPAGARPRGRARAPARHAPVP